MMPALQYLRHGKALCGKVFNRFVETFNFHNDFIANLKGDGDLPGSDGCMNFDTTDPKHPVIRLNKNKLDLPEHGGEDRDAIPGRFEITITPDDPPEEGSEEKQTYTATFENPYYDIGGKTYEMSSGSEEEDVSLEDIKDGSIIFIKISAEGSETGAELGTAASLRELQSVQENEPGKYTIPLYKVEGGSVTCDFRTGPIAGMGEA